MRMNDARDFAVKLFGIYCFVQFIITTAQFAVYFPAYSSSRVGLVVCLVPVIALLLYLSLTWLFVFRTASIVRRIWGASDAPETDSQDFHVPITFSFWIVLIGVFYFIKSLANALSQLTVFALSDVAPVGSYWIVNCMSAVILLILSVFCILKSTTIEGFLLSKTRADMQGEGAGGT